MSAMKKLRGPGNPNWKGGRVVDPRGYVLVKNLSHPRADVRGYVYEHVLIAEEMLGRRLAAKESVRRIDSRRPFTPDNITVSGSWRYQNSWIQCACGCRTVMLRFDPECSGRERTFVSGHNTAGGGASYGKAARRRYGLTRDDFAELMDHWDNECAYGCGRRASSIDHILPRSRGGTNRADNLVPACSTCNSSKLDREWMSWVARGMLERGDPWLPLIDAAEWALTEWWDLDLWVAEVDLLIAGAEVGR